MIYVADIAYLLNPQAIEGYGAVHEPNFRSVGEMLGITPCLVLELLGYVTVCCFLVLG